MTSNLRQTVFCIDRLDNVVNVGGCIAYQVFVSSGKVLGQIGTIVNPATLIPANEEKFLTEAANSTSKNTPASWLRRTLTTLTT